jgi:hypothetical protein
MRQPKFMIPMKATGPRPDLKRGQSSSTMRQEEFDATMERILVTNWALRSSSVSPSRVR